MSARIRIAQRLVESAATSARRDAEKVKREAEDAAERTRLLRKEARVFGQEADKLESAKVCLAD